MRRLLDHPAIYAAWQAPFVRQKVAPFLRHNRIDLIRRVLDVGCGPGTNARLFAAADYLGVDIDPGYVARAVERFGPRFRVGDAAALDFTDGVQFDCLFINSLTHHLDDGALDALLSRTDLLADDGQLHLIDLHLPERGIPRWLALADRGQHPRPLPDLRAAIGRHWAVECEETFHLKMLGIRMWAMVYFRARPRSVGCASA